MRSMATQLRRPYSGISRRSRMVENSYATSQEGKIPPKLTDLRLLLNETLTEKHHLYIIIDALDECEELERRRLLAWLRDVFNAFSQDNTHVLVTRRTTQDIRRTMYSLRARWISISGEGVDRDIKAFIVRELETRQGPWAYEGNDEIMNDVMENLLGKANGV